MNLRVDGPEGRGPLGHLKLITANHWSSRDAKLWADGERGREAEALINFSSSVGGSGAKDLR